MPRGLTPGAQPTIAVLALHAPALRVPHHRRALATSAPGRLRRSTAGREAARSADTTCCTYASPAFAGIDFYFRTRPRIRPAAQAPAGALVVPVRAGATADCAKGKRWWTSVRQHRDLRGPVRAAARLPFVAVMPASTAPAKIEAVRALRPLRTHRRRRSVHAGARAIAADGACFLDQFGSPNAPPTGRGNNNIAESIIGQLANANRIRSRRGSCAARAPAAPSTIGRYLRYREWTRACAWPNRRRRLRPGLAQPRSRAAAAAPPDRGHRPGGWNLASCSTWSTRWSRSGRGFDRRHGCWNGSAAATAVPPAPTSSPASNWLPRCARGDTGSIATLLCDRGERYAGNAVRPRLAGTAASTPEPAAIRRGWD